MSDTWKQWEGHIVDGEFPLLRYLGESEDCAVFLTERHDGELLIKAGIKLIPAAPDDGELQLSRWQQASELSHPHLILLYEMGRSELGGTPFIYIVMQCAEENLAQVLPDRALTAAEAGAMLKSVLDVLTYIHRNGFVHCHIKPANIMASDDQLKVSSDGLRRTGESLDDQDRQSVYDPPEVARGVIPIAQTVSPARDVWSLGMTLVETMTQIIPVVPVTEHLDPLLPQTLPEPFLDIARHCLLRHPEDRWTVAQIEDRLEGRAPIHQGGSIPSKVVAPLPAPLPIARLSRSTAKHSSYTWLIAIGFVAVLTAILVGPKLLRHNTGAPQVPATADAQPLVQSTLREQAPSPQEPLADADKSNVGQGERNSNPLAPVPAVIHPETLHEEATSTVARLPAGSPIRGEVALQVMPEVLQSARDTIRGTVRVSVKVNVDRSGNVEDAHLESPGPSKYFARAALKAAQLWKFKPSTFGGQGGLGSWTLQFEFTRDRTTVVPVQEMP